MTLPKGKVASAANGQDIRDAYERLGLNQVQASQQLGMAQNMLSEYVNARRPMSARFALKFEAVLGLSAEALMIEQARAELAAERGRIAERPQEPI